MSRFVVEAGERDGQAITILRDTQTGANAQLWPGCGNNCFSLTLPDPTASGGKLVSVIAAPPSLEEIRRRPSWWGIPLLFPFSGTIPKGEYAFQGQKLRLRAARATHRLGRQGVSRRTPGLPRFCHGLTLENRRDRGRR